jgi:hypothetical protein
MICDEVEMVGFGIELLEVIENNQEELLKKQFTLTNMTIDFDGEEVQPEIRNNKNGGGSIKTCSFKIYGIADNDN